MKKNTIYIVICLMVVLQVVSLIKISNLENQTRNIQNNLSNRIENVSRNVNSIYKNIDEILNKHASIIASSDYKIGDINVSNFTVPITFTVTPKEISKSTSVSLDIEGKYFPMDKNGTTYVVTISHSIFDDAMPKVVIDENGILKTEQPNRLSIRNIKGKLIPELDASLLGQSTYGSDIYHRTGNLTIQPSFTPSDLQFNDARLVIKVDDEVISDKKIFLTENSLEWENLESEIDEEIALTNGQTCTMTVIATDKFGLRHHKVVDYYKANSDEFMEDRWLDEEIIYSADGELLWKPDYIKMEY